MLLLQWVCLGCGVGVVAGSGCRVGRLGAPRLGCLFLVLALAIALAPVLVLVLALALVLVLALALALVLVRRLATMIVIASTA